MQLALSAPAPLAVSARASVRGASVRLAAPRQAQVGRGSLAVRAGKVQLITAEELEIAIAERDKPLVIDFYARQALSRLAARGGAFCLLSTRPACFTHRSWCGPCVLMAAELEKARREADTRWPAMHGPELTPSAAQVAEELGDAVRIVKIDTEAEPELSSQLQVRAARREACRQLWPHLTVRSPR